MDLSHRIELIIKSKEKNKKSFAEVMGWSQAYLSKLLSGDQGIGLTPLMQILDKFKDIDARWLIFGEGYMFGSIENGLLSKFMRLLEIEKYVSEIGRAHV